MQTLTVNIPSELSEQLAPYQENIDQLLLLGLREFRLRQSLTLFKQGNVSVWKAARLAQVSFREMLQYLVAQGIQPHADEETIHEELA